MERYQDKQQENAVHAASAHAHAGTISRFPDFRATAITQRQIQQIANNSPRTAQLKTIQAMADKGILQRFPLGMPIQKMEEEEDLLQGKFEAVQRMGPEEEDLLQGKFETVQRMGPEEEDLLQGKFEAVQRMAPDEEDLLQGKFETVQRQKNNTGLPDTLKAGVEGLSGMSMDDVQVHFNSDKPAPLQAHAYTQGTDIHVAPGQERHLAHEAWHVVQQKQGRVQPTMSLNGQQINDNPGLEQEADVMGAKAQSSGPQQFRLKKR